MSHSEDLDPIINADDQSIDDIRSSLDESQYDVAATVAELCSRYHDSKLLLDLSKLQLRYALGIFLDRANDFDISEAVLHQALHCGRGRIQAVHQQVDSKMRMATYSGSCPFYLVWGTSRWCCSWIPLDVPRLTEGLLDGDFALLDVYGVDFARITSEDSFNDLENEADVHFDEQRNLGW
jgi:hypothetical protein